MASVLSAELAGKDGNWLPITFNAALVPLRLTMRARIRPVTPVSTGVLTHSFELGGTALGLCQFPGTAVAVAPALSPCQPLLSPMSPCVRRSELIVILPPRFGT